MDFKITDNGIELIEDESKKEDIKDIYFRYEKSYIPSELIKECNDLSIELDKTMFIFDCEISNRLFNDNLDGIYHIGDESYFTGMPSRFSYYDTETKLIDRYKKYELVIDFLTSYGFIGGENNFGPEYEQSYFINCDTDFYIVRIQPNLFINLIYNSKSVYTGFFNIEIINKVIETTSSLNIKRDFILNNILTKNVE